MIQEERLALVSDWPREWPIGLGPRLVGPPGNGEIRPSEADIGVALLSTERLVVEAVMGVYVEPLSGV